MAMTVNSISSNDTFNIRKSKISFRGSDTQVVGEQKPDTFEKQGKSGNKKLLTGLGIVLLTVLSAIGLRKGIKVRNTNKALRQAANTVGIEDVKLYKNLKEIFRKITKLDGKKLEYDDMVRSMQQLTNKGTIKDGDKFMILAPEKVQEFFSTYYKEAKVPKDSVAVMVKSADGKKIKYRELIIPDGLGESFKDLIVDPTKVHVIPVKVVE